MNSEKYICVSWKYAKIICDLKYGTFTILKHILKRSEQVEKFNTTEKNRFISHSKVMII